MLLSDAVGIVSNDTSVVLDRGGRMYTLGETCA